MNTDNNEKAIQQTFNFYAPIGQQIAHVDKLEAHFDKDMGMVVNGQQVGQEASSAGNGCALGSSPDEEWIDEVVNCFMGDRENALEFMRMARCLLPRQITELVNAWVKQRKISKLSCNRNLWRPLYEHGVYTCSESNWNNQIR